MVNVIVTVSQGHNRGVVGKVRLGSTVMGGSKARDGRTDGWLLQEATMM